MLVVSLLALTSVLAAPQKCRVRNPAQPPTVSPTSAGQRPLPQALQQLAPSLTSSAGLTVAGLPFAVPFKLPGDPSDINPSSTPTPAPPLTGKQIDLKNLPADKDIKNFYCSGLYSIRGFNEPLPANPNQAQVDAYFIAAANQLRKISGLPPFELNSCLSLHALGAALTGLPGHGGFGSLPPGVSDCGTFNAAEGLIGTQNYMPWWARIQAGLCMFMGDGHRGPYLDPKTTKIGYNFFPDKGDLKATSITFRVEYG
jgi:uncharacterized protein YkwD